MNLNVKTHSIVDMSKKSFLGVLGIFVLGIIIGYVIYQFFSVGWEPFFRIIIPIFTGITFFAVATLVVRFVPIIINSRNKKEEKRLWRDKLILDDIRNWESKTTFANIIYNFIEVVPISHIDPTSLPYFDKDCRVLKKYELLTLWEKGKIISDDFKNDGNTALNIFHKIIDKRLKQTQLKRVLKMAVKLTEPFYSLPHIRKLIIDEINGEHTEITVNEHNDYLCRGDTTFAKGSENERNNLKKIIEALIRDKDVKQYIETYQQAKSKLDGRFPFLDFRIKLEKFFNDFDWDKKFKR